MLRHTPPAEHVVEPRLDPGASTFDNAAPRTGRRRHLILIEPVEFSVEILRENAFHRAELHRVRQRLVEFLEGGRPGLVLFSKLGLDISRTPPNSESSSMSLIARCPLGPSSSSTPIFIHSSRMRFGT